jgi:hypothetical protein
MPQYVYVVNGQRHVFEGPDPQTTAQFAQRWADQVAGRTPVTVSDIQRRLGPKPNQFDMDLSSRARADVADLTGAIGDAKAHPADLLSGPKIVGALTRYVPNVLGLVPAATVDQVTGPVVRGFNTQFGTHFDPRYATDQILNAAGLLSGAPEVLGPETSLARAGETSDIHPSSSGSGMSAARRVFGRAAGVPRATAQDGELPQFTPLKSNLTVASRPRHRAECHWRKRRSPQR